ncbi:hypothetical protein D3C79_869070 [compost metagenome]
MKLQAVILTRQARQGVRPRYRATPQHHMLTGLVTQRALRPQAQAQHIAKPVQFTRLRGDTFLQGVEQRHAQVIHHPTLAGQAPSLCVFLQRQCLGQGIRRLPVQAMHQAGMATARTAAVGHIQARLVQGIEQVTAGGHRPAALAHTEFRHGHRSPE